MVANTICDDSLADKKKMILKIKTLFAFDLFCQNNKFKGIRMDIRIILEQAFCQKILILCFKNNNLLMVLLEGSQKTLKR
jgi:hypothetical protein